MSAHTTPRSVRGMLAWLRAHPDEPFRTSWVGDRLLVGTRSDDGEMYAWDCTVNHAGSETAPRGRGRGGA